MGEFIRWRGAVVPWVAQWTNEENATPFGVMGTYPTSRVAMHQEGLGDRDRHGVLWWRTGISRGGTPQFAQLNTYRQRAAMLKRRCQICGDKLPDGPIEKWLMGGAQVEEIGGAPITTNPPTCVDCVPVALELCPHLLGGGWRILRVVRYDIWGVHGEVAFHTQDGAIHRANDVRMPYSHPKIQRVMVGKQQAVELVDFEVVEQA